MVLLVGQHSILHITQGSPSRISGSHHPTNHHVPPTGIPTGAQRPAYYGRHVPQRMWPGEHISQLLKALRKKLRLFTFTVRGHGSACTNSEWVHYYAYLTIEATKEYAEECENGRTKSRYAQHRRSSITLFFNKAYTLYVKKGASMCNTHIANQSWIVSITSAKALEVANLRNKMAALLAQERECKVGIDGTITATQRRPKSKISSSCECTNQMDAAIMNNRAGANGGEGENRWSPLFASAFSNTK